MIFGDKSGAVHANIKSDCGLDFFFTFITVLGMSKISKNIGFDALLVFEQDQI